MRPLARSLLIAAPLALLLLLGLTARAQAGALAISSPAAGDALQGVVSISGTSALDGFERAELDFAYSRDVTATWFPLAASDQPVTDGVLATWDTTTISDGEYDLRLTIFLADGSQQSVSVEGVRVRNTTPIETNTPQPTVMAATGAPTRTPEPTLRPQITASLPAPQSSATPLPANPLQVSAGELGGSLLLGASGAGALILLLLAYLALKAAARR